MLKTIKKVPLKLSLITALVVVPLASQAASSSGVVDSSSESSSALIESPNVEQQINRVAVGISFIRLNTVILQDMPISGDSEWVDELVKPMDSKLYKKVMNSPAVKNDPYYSTVAITNALLGRASLSMSPLNARLYLELLKIYKNDTNVAKNEKGKYAIPDIYALPSFKDMNTFLKFPQENHGKKVELIEVNAKKFNLYENVKLATISLTPKKYQKKLIEAMNNYDKAKLAVAKVKGEVKELKAKLDDNKNVNNPNRKKWEQSLKMKENELEKSEKDLDIVEEIYVKLIEEAALAIESNIQSDFRVKKVPLAKKLQKLLDLIDNNSMGAITMFTAASTHLLKNGIGTLDKELQALTAAQAISSLTGNQKEFISERLARMGKGAIMLLPNIAVGMYFAAKQSHEAGKYQVIVDKVLEIAKAQEEAEKAAKEAAKKVKK